MLYVIFVAKINSLLETSTCKSHHPWHYGKLGSNTHLCQWLDHQNYHKKVRYGRYKAVTRQLWRWPPHHHASLFWCISPDCHLLSARLTVLSKASLLHTSVWVVILILAPYTWEYDRYGRYKAVTPITWHMAVGKSFICFSGPSHLNCIGIPRWWHYEKL